MKHIIVFFLIVGALGGCAPRQVFVTLRDVPQQPTFVVIPANNIVYQVEYANRIEAALIASGVSVVSRPATKSIRTERQLTQAEAGSEDKVETADATLIEEYRAYDDLGADYMISTFADSRQIKIELVSTKEILAALTVRSSSNPSIADDSNEIMRAALKSIGISVRVN